MARLDQPLRIVQISDTHIQAQPGGKLWGVDVDANLDAVLRRLQTRHWPVEFILATGDLVHDEGAPAYDRLRALLKPLGVPVYCLPGNHDTSAILQQALAANPVCWRRHVTAGRWQFIFLDSSLPGSDGGHLPLEELTLLENTLAAHPELHALVVLHHQPLPVGTAWLDTMVVDNGADLFAVLDRHPQVRAVVWGHIHHDFTAQRQGVHLLGAPSTCVQFKPATAQPQADSLPPGYRWFELYPDGRLVTGIERNDQTV